ncbi:hypothetical protein JHW43_009587 [Diplocarpon mali]|nr:hypothetical protein JHW43_009587 [Diplocarpon mali]
MRFILVLVTRQNSSQEPSEAVGKLAIVHDESKRQIINTASAPKLSLIAAVVEELAGDIESKEITTTVSDRAVTFYWVLSMDELCGTEFAFDGVLNIYAVKRILSGEEVENESGKDTIFLESDAWASVLGWPSAVPKPHASVDFNDRVRRWLQIGPQAGPRNEDVDMAGNDFSEPLVPRIRMGVNKKGKPSKHPSRLDVLKNMFDAFVNRPLAYIFQAHGA